MWTLRLTLLTVAGWTVGGNVFPIWYKNPRNHWCPVPVCDFRLKRTRRRFLGALGFSEGLGKCLKIKKKLSNPPSTLWSASSSISSVLSGKAKVKPSSHERNSSNYFLKSQWDAHGVGQLGASHSGPNTSFLRLWPAWHCKRRTRTFGLVARINWRAYLFLFLFSTEIWTRAGLD